MKTTSERERLALLVHELRSPVAALAAISEALAEGRLDAGSLRELVRLTRGACRSVERIVDDAALGQLRLSHVDVAGVVRDAVAAAALEGGCVEANVESGLPPIRADEVRLRQALDNLIRNARVHSRSRSGVVVAASRNRGSILLSVTDSGRGIAEADQARIFEPGVRLDAAEPGSGLGLAVARAIARAHGGTLGVKSDPGSGTTFTLTLPLETGLAADSG